MVNLLPQKTKKSFVIAYYLTYSALLFALLGLMVALGAGLLVPSYFLAREEVISTERYLSALEETVGLKEQTGSREIVLQLAESVDILSSFEGSRASADILVEIDRSVPRRVSIQGIGITHFGARAGEVIVAGVADTRADLLAFSDALKANPLFDSVSVPVNQLAPETDLKFSFSFHFEKKNDL